MRPRFLAGILLAASSLASCTRTSVIPAYILIPAIQVTSDYPTEGSASHKVVDAWVFVDDDAQGVFQLPALIPLPFAGEHEISILAGVLKDGKSVERIAYPFYSLFSTHVQFVTGHVDTIVPTVSYNGLGTFLAIEDFDLASSGFGMNRTTVDSLVYEGSGSGLVILTTAGPSVTAESEPYAIPHDGSLVFLELDYRNETPFEIHLNDSKTLQDHYLITISPKDLWNKVYVDLTVPVNRYPADDYRIKFKSDLGDSMDQAVNYWDNIKLLHL
jgi:hypothetical protein